MRNEKFGVYGNYDCKVISGDEIKLKRSLYGYANQLQEELEEALNCDYNNKLTELQTEEKKIFDDMQKQLDEWQVIAEKIIVMDMAKKYNDDCQKAEELETTENKWINTKEWRNNEFRISNKTYIMNIRVYEDTHYEDGKEIPCKWEVSYWLSLNSENRKLIASMNKKSFKDKEKAYKYVEGRKKYFSKYFKELYQPIESEYAENFKSCGKLIKNYKIKE